MKKSNLIHARTCVYNVNYHIVWSVKYRRKVLNAEPPDYTSQTCPVCSCCNSLNRSKTDSKKFRCTCCGYEDDADHVGAVNIRNRATDTDLLEVCQKSKNHKALQSGIKKLLDSRNISWLTANQKTPILHEPEKAISLS